MDQTKQVMEQRRPLREGVGRNEVIFFVKRLLSHVALYARAWVEIFVAQCGAQMAAVALYARAWVEILCLFLGWLGVQSPSTRGRG